MDRSVNIRARLSALRERQQMTQEDLAQALGFKDRQILSSIELGERRISSEEMMRAAKVFGVSIDYFTDPFELAGEGHFSWRQRKANAKDIDQFERSAGHWIAAYRYLSRLKGCPINSSLRRVALTDRSSYEEAWAEGEAIAGALKLSDAPARHLAGVLEDQLDTLVLYVDTLEGISGAACQLDQLNAILINRNEPAGRRSFDLAHELFHLLTWHQMPPEHVEGEARAAAMGAKEKRIEQLADNFAGALLMPTQTLQNLIRIDPIPAEIGALTKWLASASKTIGVSVSALKWRLVCIGALKKNLAARVVGNEGDEGDLPPPRFSKRFVETIGWGIEEGHLSVRRASSLLEMTIDDLARLFSEHGQKAPFSL